MFIDKYFEENIDSITNCKGISNFFNKLDTQKKNDARLNNFCFQGKVLSEYYDVSQRLIEKAKALKCPKNIILLIESKWL